jgi:thiopeptide-type bacteriocin biosynthesis protein
VALVDRDKQLPVDLENVLCVEAAFELLKSQASGTFVEVFFGDQEVFAGGPEGRFLHELVVPFLRVKKTAKAVLPIALRASQPITRNHHPGSEWLYCKLYLAASLADQVLRSVVFPVVRAAMSSGAATSWFFIRYGDPDWHIRLRVQGPPARLLDEVFPSLVEACSPLMAERLVRGVHLETYEREVDRYGGPTGVILSERLFHADSEAVLDVIERESRLAGQNTGQRWRLALVGIDRLLADLGLDLPAKRALVREAGERLSREFHRSGGLQQRLNERYRSERPGLESLLLGSPREEAAAEGAGLTDRFPCFEHRSLAVQPIVAALREAERTGRLTKPLGWLTGGFVHLHANRMLRSAGRAQELVLYDFLSRLYESQAARAAGRAEIRQPTSRSRPHRFRQAELGAAHPFLGDKP